MTPGQAPVREDGQTFGEMQPFARDDRSWAEVWAWMRAFGDDHIEPIEDET